ncbi:MAG: hypothetical protein Kow0060_18870 [Methylohalobius crimeensis]
MHQVVGHLAGRLVGLLRRDGNRSIPAYSPDRPLQHDPNWRDTLLFHEYFHAETGRGLGASHQTGWTALVANLILKGHRR